MLGSAGLPGMLHLSTAFRESGINIQQLSQTVYGVNTPWAPARLSRNVPRKNKRNHYGKEKQRRQNDDSKKTRGQWAGRKRHGQESSCRAENHEHLTERAGKSVVEGRFTTTFFCVLPFALIARRIHIPKIRGRVSPHGGKPGSGLTWLTQTLKSGNAVAWMLLPI